MGYPISILLAQERDVVEYLFKLNYNPLEVVNFI
jgi:hypothetical protein